MRISIGILAWNEAASIEATIRSVLGQTLMSTPDADVEAIELICVPNGCTDNTAAIAKGAMERYRPTAVGSILDCKVHELERPGKPNAWNEFMHRLADQRADYVIMLDGDITLGTPDTLRNLVHTLQHNPDAYVAVPQVLKDIALKPRKTLWNRISLAGSEARLSAAASPGIAGCCYCARGSILRRLHFADGMLGEDAFLNGVMITDLLRSRTPRPELIVRAPSASVIFEAYTSISDLWCNQRRRAVTRGINAILYEYLWQHTGPEIDAGAVIKARNDEDPQWFRKLLQRRIDEKGWWVLPKGILLGRLRQLKGLSIARALRRTPVILLGVGFDLFTHLAANRILKKKGSENVWKDKNPASMTAAVG